jgi:hypothetical protein
MEEDPIRWNVGFYITKTTLQSLYNIKAAANPQGRLAEKHIFIHAHRFLLAEQEASGRSPFLRDKPLYDIPEQLLNLITHFMIFSKS